MTTFVLVPGLLSDKVVWKALCDKLGPNTFVADLSRDTDIREMANGLLRRIEGDIVAVGHSMGGRVAMEIARQAPDRVRALVLLSTGHNGGTDAELPKRRARIALGHESMAKLADDWLPPMVAPGRRNDTSLMQKLHTMVLRHDGDIHERQIHALINRPNAAAYLPDIVCPILLLVGDQDEWSPVKQHLEIAGMAPDAHVQIIEGAGHFLPIEKPDETVAAIAAWFNEKGISYDQEG